MQTARVTVLMTPERKAAMEVSASGLGVSTGEYIRLAVDNYTVAPDDAILDVLVAELREAIPQMQADFAAINVSIADARAAIDAALRATGGRA